MPGNRRRRGRQLVRNRLARTPQATASKSALGLRHRLNGQRAQAWRWSIPLKIIKNRQSNVALAVRHCSSIFSSAVYPIMAIHLLLLKQLCFRFLTFISLNLLTAGKIFFSPWIGCDFGISLVVTWKFVWFFLCADCYSPVTTG